LSKFTGPALLPDQTRKSKCHREPLKESTSAKSKRLSCRPT
jgi:hypothetical protein